MPLQMTFKCRSNTPTNAPSSATSNGPSDAHPLLICDCCAAVGRGGIGVLLPVLLQRSQEPGPTKPPAHRPFLPPCLGSRFKDLGAVCPGMSRRPEGSAGGSAKTKSRGAWGADKSPQSCLLFAWGRVAVGFSKTSDGGGGPPPASLYPCFTLAAPETSNTPKPSLSPECGSRSSWVSVSATPGAVELNACSTSSLP